MSGRGKLFGVGVGPGDAELLTLKAVRLLKAADLIAIPQKDRDRCLALRIAEGAVPEVSAKPLLCLDMPMTRDKDLRERACDEAARQLTAALGEGRTVAFLTLGDPSVYSTYGYLHGRILSAGYEAEMVPGVPSFCAAAAALGTPLCLDGEGLRILPGRETEAETRVYMKGSAAQIKERLRAHPGPILGAVNVGMEGQRLYKNREEIPDDSGYFTLIITKETEL